MASLTASDPNEIALVSSPTSGTATFHVDPTGSGANVETWERDLAFGAVTSPPPFVNTGTFSAIANVKRGVPLGGVHQVRLFRQNQGHPSGVPSNPGSLLGRLDFPCVRRAARINFLTRCASMPQIDITRGGTFVSMSFAVNVPARARVQIGVNPPTIDAAGFPVFAPADIVSSVLSDGPKLLQKASLGQEPVRIGRKRAFGTADEPEAVLHRVVLRSERLLGLRLEHYGGGATDRAGVIQDQESHGPSSLTPAAMPR